MLIGSSRRSWIERTSWVSSSSFDPASADRLQLSFCLVALVQEALEDGLGVGKCFQVQLGLVPVELIGHAIDDDTGGPLRKQGRVCLAQQGAVAEAPVYHLLLADGVKDSIHVCSGLWRVDVGTVLPQRLGASPHEVARPGVELSAVFGNLVIADGLQPLSCFIILIAAERGALIR